MAPHKEGPADFVCLSIAGKADRAAAKVVARAKDAADAAAAKQAAAIAKAQEVQERNAQIAALKACIKGFH